jgi:anti-sigma B factor antagonist
VATQTGSTVSPRLSDGFVASTERLVSGAPVVSVTGEVDLATAPALERSLRSAVENRTGGVIVDLTSCSFLDAGGLTVLNETRASLARSNRALALVMSKPIVLKIFQITGVEKQFAIYPSLGAAVDAGAGAHV